MQLLPCAKTCVDCNTGAGNYATAAVRENLWPLQYKHGKLCICGHARENLWWLHYKRGKTYGGYNTRVVNYATAPVPRQSPRCGGCNTSAGNYSTSAVRGKNCGGFKRGTMQLMLSAGKHGNCRCKHTACFTSEKRALALTCSLRTVWTSEGVSWTVYTNFFTTSSNLIFESGT